MLLTILRTRNMPKRKQEVPLPQRESWKKRKPSQKFREDYSKQYPCVMRSSVSTHHARCTVCAVDIAVSHGGVTDIERHVKSARHQEMGKVATPSVTTFFKKPQETDLKLIRAETLFTQFLVEHNIPLSVADHAKQLMKRMFPDSETAKQFACGRTKTTAIIKCVAKETVKKAASCLRTGPFTIGTDGSQEGGDKFFPIVARFLDGNNQVCTELLAIPVCSDSATGENIFSLLEESLTSLNVPWENCIALVCDNANVMTGRNKGVIAYIRQHVPNVFLAGCVCHRLNLAAKKATKAFQICDFDDTLRQLAWYINKSSNRQHRLQDLQKECGTPLLQVVDHCPTRWLSMGQALNRLLQQWEPLYKFFKAECAKKEAKVEDDIRHQLKIFLGRRTARVYATFLACVVQFFDKLNTKLQTDSAVIHVVKRSLEDLYRKLLLCFVKPSALKQALLDVDFTSKYNIKSPDDLFIGTETRALISAGMTEKTKEQFFRDVTFYQTACLYLKKNVLTSGQPLWKHAEVADLSLRADIKFSSLEYFVKQFPCLLPAEASFNDLQLQFLDYQTWDVPAEVECLETAEEQWGYISTVKDVNGSFRFKTLAGVMMGILLIPASNASCERVFSVVRKNKTDFRAAMGPHTVEAVMILKAKGGNCYDAELSEELLQKCKSATYMSMH